MVTIFILPQKISHTLQECGQVTTPTVVRGYSHLEVTINTVLGLAQNVLTKVTFNNKIHVRQPLANTAESELITRSGGR